MTEPRDPSPAKATGESGVAGSRRGAEEPSGSTVPDVPVADRPAEGDPTTSSLSEMVAAAPEPTPPDEVEEVTDSGLTDPYSPTGTRDDPTP
jgi:hypothetical protein